MRSAIEKSVTENSLRIAVGELPKPPAFLIGQVGDQRIAFHGTSGSFFLTQENKNGELSGNNISNGNSTEKEELSTKVDTNEATEGFASHPDQAAMDAGECRRSFTSTEENSDTDAVLARSVNESASCGSIRDQADTILAAQYASDIRHERGIINQP